MSACNVSYRLKRSGPKVTPKATYIISHLQCENATTFEEAPFSHVDAIF